MNRFANELSSAPQTDLAGTTCDSLSRQGLCTRVALLTMDFPPNTGGVQRYLLELSRRVARHYCLTVTAPLGDPSLFHEEPFSFVSLPSSMPWQFAKVLATLRPHITIVGHAHPRMLLPAAILSRGRYIVLAHSSDFEVAQSRWHAPLFNRLLACARPLVTVSRNSARRLKGFAQTAPEVVFPGVDPNTFVPSETPLTGPPVLLTVSRLVPRKGHGAVMAALPSLLKSVPELEYWIAGDGPERGGLERLARSLDVAHAVRFLGDVAHDGSSAGIPHLPELYRRASIFVMPTQVEQSSGRGEGFPLVYLEASASGLPVVAARSGGAAEAVIENKTGLLVPPDDPVALERALHRLLLDPEMRQRMGRAGRRWVEREMNWDRVGRQFLSIIDRAS